MADAEAICEAVQRPTMHFVAIKNEETQGAAVMLRARDLLIRQRTQTINALRGHLAEFGEVAAKGTTYASKLIAMGDDPQTALPETARTALRYLTAILSQLNDQIRTLDAQIMRRAREDETARRLMTIPGIGPLIATTLVALAPSPETFKRGRDFAAWLGLVPRQHSTGGKQRLGSTTKMGERSLRRLLIIGANSELVWRTRKGPPRNVASKDARAQTTDAGESSACQQDGAHRLGYNGQGRNIQSSGCCGLNQANATEGTSQRERSLEGMAQRSRDRIRITGPHQSVSRARGVVLCKVRLLVGHPVC